ELTLGGANLTKSQEILFYSPGFTVKSLTPADNAVKAVVAVASDCRLGIHALRVRSLEGVSDLRTFTVGSLPEVKEVEPNNDFTAPQAVPLGSTISGIVQSEDIDQFVVDLKKGDRLTAELEGLRLGYTFFDPYVAILNASRFELSRSDDAALLSQDCLASIVAPEDGKYIVQVRETSFGGSGSSFYRLHIGGFPRPTAVYPAGGKPGETLAVKWIGDARGEFTSQVTLPTSGETAELFAQDSGGQSPSANVVRVIDLANTLEAEPNDAVAQATVGALAPLALNGIIEKDGDVDFFKFTAKKGQQLDVRVYARKPLRSPLDPVLVVYNAQGGGIASNDDTGGPDSYLRFNPPADGEYLLSVNDQLRTGGPDFIYRVELTEIKPALTMRLPERRQYVSTTLSVPKNNRMAVMVAAQRQNFGGDLAVTFAGLPAGMAFETVPMTAALTEIPVVFSAAADAQPAGTLVEIIGKPTDANLPIVGRLNQRTMLVRGQNNIDVWGHDADRMATVLTEEVPYRIDIVPPKAPLVRNGSLGLKVVATRAAGFTAPISLRLLYNPPGVASSGSINIAENQNEAIIPLTANGGAAIGTWKLCVVGRSGSREDSIRCSTQLADLTIADQFYKLTFDKSAVEQGKETEVAIKVEKLRDFEGTAKAELVGLPANATTQPIEFTKDTPELVFKVAASAQSRPGRYPSLICVTNFAVEGETVTHTLGTGELRIDAPLPPKPNAPPAATPAAAAAPMPAAAPMKRLTRLEQLRLDKEQQGKK
ncbi:MAG: PPC domain-containing protein, partial [Planctomycetaceae bacterium]|nr:PPC domain-containing protein [Planctomycetaceae bacterium]